MLDLDDFRTVNNDRGHQAGDALLRRIAAGSSGPVATRTSCSATAATSSRSCCRTRTRPARSTSRNGPGRRSSARTCRSPPRSAWRPSRSDGQTATEVLLAADRACYVAKRSGRDRIATAAEGLALAAEISLQPPTPVDSANHAGGRDRPSPRRAIEASLWTTCAPAAPRSAASPSPLLLVAVVARRLRPGPGQPVGVRRGRRRRHADPGTDARRARPRRPSFVRPTPTPQPTFFVYTVKRGDNLEQDRQAVRDGRPEHRLLEPVAYPSLDPDSGQYRPNYIVVGWMLQLIPNTVVDPENLPPGPPTPSPDASRPSRDASDVPID